MLRFGSTDSVVTFQDIGGNGTADLTKIVPSGYDEFSTDQVYIDTLKSDGTTDESYQWIHTARKHGWYADGGDGDLVEEDDVTFDPGAGVSVTGEDGLYLNFSTTAFVD